MTEHDAELHNWTLVSFNGFAILDGYIHKDSKGRWKDGTYVTTSYLKSPVDALKAGAVAQTRNTRYRLGDPYVQRED